MKAWIVPILISALCQAGVRAATLNPAPQQFRQEVAAHYTQKDGLPNGAIQLLQPRPDGSIRVFAAGQWFEKHERQWQANAEISPRVPGEFVFSGATGKPSRVAVPWSDVHQLLAWGPTNFVAARQVLFSVLKGQVAQLNWPNQRSINQAAVAPDGSLWVASSEGLFQQAPGGWDKVELADSAGRIWSGRDVLGVAWNASELWIATRAGVVARTRGTLKFYEGKDGLPWNDFTGITPDPTGGVWFSTHLGAIHFDGSEWQYRQGPRWLPHDDVAAVVSTQEGSWFATRGGLGFIERRPMSLADKAELYEGEIEKFIKRTPYGFVAEAYLRVPADKTSADPQDSDNDGLWTSMYGAGECFAYAATKSAQSLARARKAFEALRFLQKVTQGGEHSPPKGYIARTIRSSALPDPNPGRLEQDKEAQKGDRLWKAYEPRWPKSADGQWFWKSDTSSDELDGHYFFYPLYYDFCAETAEEKDRVREVVRDITDHLLEHRFVLIDHDGRPTRWAIYGPQFLNRDPLWWPERGLNSLSILSYLAVAAHITGDAKYSNASRELIEQSGYAHNAMYPKVQQGPGSGNQSDDEMAFMCYYSLLRCSKDEQLKSMIRYSFFRYWVNEAPEMNPFFNFAYAAHSLDASIGNVWGRVSLHPWPGWFEDAMKSLYGFPLDRLNWPHKNSHRLDILPLARVRASDLDSPERARRGSDPHGKVLPVENRHFGHWNTDPWHLDYGGNANELAAGTVFLLPYYMGLFHGFIERPR